MNETLLTKFSIQKGIHEYALFNLLHWLGKKLYQTVQAKLVEGQQPKKFLLLLPGLLAGTRKRVHSSTISSLSRALWSAVTRLMVYLFSRSCVVCVHVYVCVCVSE